MEGLISTSFPIFVFLSGLLWALITMYFDIRRLKEQVKEYNTIKLEIDRDLEELESRIEAAIKETNENYNKLDRRLVQIITVLELEKMSKLKHLD